MINKSIVVIVPCCGRGVIQAIRLQKELETNHLTYQLVQTKPRNCPQIIEKYGIQEQVEKRVPYIYIDDLCFAAEKINDKSFVAHLISQLQEIDAKAKEKELEEKKDKDPTGVLKELGKDPTGVLKEDRDEKTGER